MFVVDSNDETSWNGHSCAVILLNQVATQASEQVSMPTEQISTSELLSEGEDRTGDDETEHITARRSIHSSDGKRSGSLGSRGEFFQRQKVAANLSPPRVKSAAGKGSFRAQASSSHAVSSLIGIAVAHCIQARLE